MKSPNGKKERLVRAGFWLAPVVLISAVALYSTLGGGGGSRETVYRDLNASVQFDGRRLTIVNNDEFAWHDVLIDVNGGLIYMGYEFRPGTLSAGQEYVFAAARFVDKEGKRFDPALEEIRQVRIACEIDDRRKGMYARRMK